jgi:hypothetical protein
MTGETLYEQIAEHKDALTLIDGENDDENNDSGNEKSRQRSVQRQDGHERGERAEQASVPELGGAGDERDSEGGSRDAGGSPRSDGGKPRGSSGASQKDGEASQGNGEAPRQEEVKEPEEKPPASNAEWAKLRREAREAKAELARLKAVQVAPSVPATPTAETKPADKAAAPETPKEPDKNTNYQEWLEWKIAQADNTIAEQSKFTKELGEWRTKQENTEREQAAIRADVEAFTTIEQRYIEKNPDYSAATDFARDTYFKALKLAQPQATEAQINWAIDNEILGYARTWAKQGLDPAEEFYSMAQERFGYTPKTSEAEEEPQEERAPARRPVERPNLKTIANNKRRSASPLSGGGQGGALPLTMESVADMDMGEFSRLTPAQLAALEAEA